jgi:hypothetical protein
VLCLVGPLYRQIYGPERRHDEFGLFSGPHHPRSHIHALRKLAMINKRCPHNRRAFGLA